MAPPLIGLTIHPRNTPDAAELDLLLDWIARSVERAGGVPVLIPLGLSDESLRALYDRLDGVLFSGGGDIEPAAYGAEPNGHVDGVDAGRDRAEFALARWAVEERKPFFGICRGAQVLNVAHGGSLYRDTSEHPGAQRHAFYPDLPYDLLPHPVRLAEGSSLRRIAGKPSLHVNSLHHQACRDLAPGLRATAHAPDGLVEAIEAPGHPFGLAVQWHPECLPDDPDMRRLFEAFVEAARDCRPEIQT
jgi:putative glutamine amidotransferase